MSPFWTISCNSLCLGQWRGAGVGYNAGAGQELTKNRHMHGYRYAKERHLPSASGDYSAFGFGKLLAIHFGKARLHATATLVMV